MKARYLYPFTNEQREKRWTFNLAVINLISIYTLIEKALIDSNLSLQFSKDSVVYSNNTNVKFTILYEIETI